jgi:putative membrane protein
MIVYDYNDPFATLWWMHGSVVPSILYLSGLCTLNGAISVYFKDSYNFFVDHTPHMYIGTTIGILLVLKAHLAYQQYAEGTLTLRRCQDSIRSIAVRVNAYGHASSESNARELVTGRIKIAKYLVVFWYSIVFHMRKQRSIPKNSNLILYLSHAEMLEFEAAGVRPLTCLRWLDRSVAHLRDKGCLSDAVACTVAAEVTKLMEAFGTMERVKTYQTVPFAYYQFCNWAVFLFCFTVPASIATHNTDYVASCLCSFLVCFIYFGINFIGNDLQAPFGNGPNDIPLERYGMVIENELYQSFHFFRFRYEHFALFQEGLVVYPPDDPRNMPYVAPHPTPPPTTLPAFIRYVAPIPPLLPPASFSPFHHSFCSPGTHRMSQIFHSSKALSIPKKRSPWTPARIKITAAVRLGIPRMRRLREAKMQR